MKSQSIVMSLHKLSITHLVYHWLTTIQVHMTHTCTVTICMSDEQAIYVDIKIALSCITKQIEAAF